jgi:tripartite ATP-independent transporter DctM subunit
MKAAVKVLGRRAAESALIVAFLAGMALPLSDAVGRLLGGVHVPGSAAYLQLLTLWLAFLGGLLATWEEGHLKLSTASALGDGRALAVARLFGGAVAAAVTAVLAYASFQVVRADRLAGNMLTIGLPQWVGELVMPAALAAMALLFVVKASPRRGGRALALAAVGAVFALGGLSLRPAPLVWALGALLVVAVLLGAPVFVAMGGFGLLLFFHDATPVAAVSAEIYRLVASPTLPAIPLLTACGYVLAEGQASHRLVRLFRALFGWMPGGMAVLVAGVCALFTTFTGGSGVTIIALGGLVYPMLREEGYSEGFSLGLVTAGGSLGLLFPPSLPVILYGVVASVPPDLLYLGGLLPGFLLLVLVAIYGVWVGRGVRKERPPFSAREVAAAAWGAKWELAVPVLVIGLFASGVASLVEASAAACAFAIVTQCLVMRDLHPVRDLPRVLLKATTLIGAVLILLSSAMGLTSYLVDAEIPGQLLAAVREHVHSPVVFLLALNVFLLVLGSVLEIYSAIVILTPLVAPIGAAFGIDPVHLGVIFLANLELGFLFPPVGLNLFLSASRFGTPLPRLYRHVVPFLIITAIGVLLITYVPAMTLGVLELLGRR